MYNVQSAVNFDPPPQGDGMSFAEKAFISLTSVPLTSTQWLQAERKSQSCPNDEPGSGEIITIAK